MVTHTPLISLTLLVAGHAALAQPVARDMIEDADRSETLYVEGADSTLTPYASMHPLGDLDADGVQEILLTHVDHALGVPPLNDYLRTVVRSPLSGADLLVLPLDETAGVKLAHTAATMIDDINADDVRDIAVARATTIGVKLRVHCGATGAILSETPVDPTSPFGLNLAYFPPDDVGRVRLLTGRIATSDLSVIDPFAIWTPTAADLVLVRPANFFQSNPDDATGYTIVHLGINANGDDEYLTADFPEQTVGLYAGEKLEMRGRYRANAEPPSTNLRVGAGGARLGDLDGDGREDVVLSGIVPRPFASGEYGIPVMSGRVPDATLPLPNVKPILLHQPEIVTNIPFNPTVVLPQPDKSLVSVGDATGDGFPDYAFLGSLPVEDPSGCLVAVCGRTGQAFFAAEFTHPLVGDLIIVHPRPYFADVSNGRNALVSPGDLNNDGAHDLLVLVRVADYAQSPPRNEQLLLTHYLPTPCAGDTDFDRAVDFTDLNAVLSNFGAHDITSPADLNASGVVDFADLNLVLSAFGQACD